MKKGLMLLAGMLAVGCLFAGCKKEENTTSSEPPAQEATPTPAVETPVPENQDDDLVDMRESTAEDETNVMGSKSDTALRTELVNETGAEIGSIYVRPHDSTFEDEEWGDELVQGKFTLKNSEKAVYYFNAGSGDENGLYDLRISYVEEGRSEYFYRMIPLETVSTLSFKVDDEEGNVIPYATYKTTTGGSGEVSTLNEVKKRLGYYEEDEPAQEDQSSEPAPSEDEPEMIEPTATPANPYESDSDGEVDPATEAENYIGRPLQDLIDAFGEPSGNDYQNEPETGRTGYHYYDTFTVSTTVDENNNEVVAGVW